MKSKPDLIVAAAMIRQAIMDEKSSFVDVYETEPVVRYRNSNQFFAVEGGTAWDVTPFERADERRGLYGLYKPALIGGKAYVSCPNEGAAKVLYWCLWTRRGHAPVWRLAWVQCGWVHVDELSLSLQEILNNIADEVDAGFPVLTGGRSGWV